MDPAAGGVGNASAGNAPHLRRKGAALAAAGLVGERRFLVGYLSRSEVPGRFSPGLSGVCVPPDQLGQSERHRLHRLRSALQGGRLRFLALGAGPVWTTDLRTLSAQSAFHRLRAVVQQSGAGGGDALESAAASVAAYGQPAVSGQPVLRPRHAVDSHRA